MGDKLKRIVVCLNQPQPPTQVTRELSSQHRHWLCPSVQPSSDASGNLHLTPQVGLTQVTLTHVTLTQVTPQVGPQANSQVLQARRGEERRLIGDPAR